MEAEHYRSQVAEMVLEAGARTEAMERLRAQYDELLGRLRQASHDALSAASPRSSTADANLVIAQVCPYLCLPCLCFLLFLILLLIPKLRRSMMAQSRTFKGSASDGLFLGIYPASSV